MKTQLKKSYEVQMFGKDLTLYVSYDSYYVSYDSYTVNHMTTFSSDSEDKEKPTFDILLRTIEFIELIKQKDRPDNKWYNLRLDVLSIHEYTVDEKKDIEDYVYDRLTYLRDHDGITNDTYKHLLSIMQLNYIPDFRQWLLHDTSKEFVMKLIGFDV